MGDKSIMNNKGIKGFLLVVLVLLPVLLLITFLCVLHWFVVSDSFTIGVTGFVQAVIVRGVLGALAGIVFLVFVIKLFQSGRSFKQRVISLAASVCCLAIAFFLFRAIFLDVPYLKHPETTYLGRLDFDESTDGDSPTTYYLDGVDMTGKRHSFSISKKRFEEGKALGTEQRLYAKVSYLPHTETAMTLKFLKNLDEQAAKLYPPTADLPDDWKSFSIQINDAVYSLPIPLTTFLEDGWQLSDEAAGQQISGAKEPYAAYDYRWISLSNDREQEISVLVYNTEEKTIDIADSIVGDIYVIYGNYDFSGTELRLPGGLMLGWSTREDILMRYGKPDKIYGSADLAYHMSDPVYSYWEFIFDEFGVIDEVMVHRQDYARSD